MNDLERNYYNAFVGVRDFGADNAADFKDGTAGARNFAAVGAAALEMEQSGAAQASGEGGKMTVQKGLAIAQLREDLRAINRTARALAVDDPAVGELFRMPNGSSEQTLLAIARSFLTNAAPFKNRFVEFGLPDDFIEDLQSDINDFEQSVTEKVRQAVSKFQPPLQSAAQSKPDSKPCAASAQSSRTNTATTPQTRRVDKCQPHRTRREEEKTCNTAEDAID